MSHGVTFQGTRVRDPFGFILERARGRDVLNVGAAGGVENYLPVNRSEWLHHRLERVASSLVGTDIDPENIRHAREHGVEIRQEDCETMDLGRKFDLIIFSDVIEHVNAPVAAVGNLLEHLEPTGQLLVTTPNPGYYALFVKASLNRDLGIYHDHVNSFYPENIRTICERVGGQITGLYYFTHLDRRSFGNRLKSYVGRAISRVSRRLSGSYLLTIERAATNGR